MDLASRYDVVVITDCDFLICGHIENQFKLVAGTNSIMIPCACPLNKSSIHLIGGSTEEFRKELDLYRNKRRFIGVCSSPFVSDPKRNINFYKKIWDTLCTSSSMRAIFIAIIDLGRVPDIVDLPVSLWCIPLLRDIPYTPRVVNDRRCFFCYTDKVMMIHGKWWAEPNYGSELAQRNALNFHEECRLINTEWKLPLEWG